MPFATGLDAPAASPGQQPDMFPAKPKPRLFEPHPDHLAHGEDDDEFDWLHDESIVMPQQDAVAVYESSAGHVVIRRQAAGYESEDAHIVISTPQALRNLIAALQRHAKEWGRDHARV